jgi:hypothetical protein
LLAGDAAASVLEDNDKPLAADRWATLGGPAQWP